MKTRWIVAPATCVLLGSALALAQPPGKKPEPGPEHKKLGYFVGRWKAEGDMKPNPFMPAGKVSSTDTCEWFDGGFSVVCRSEGMSPVGPTKGLGIMGYSSEEKVYTYYGVDNSPMTMASVARGTVQGDTWVYTDESKMGGKMVKGRYTIKEVSPTSYTFKWETLGEDGAWKTIVDGKVTKTS